MRLRLLHDNFHRRVVYREVMRQQKQQPARLGRIIGDKPTHHRGLLDVEPVVTRIKARAQLLADVARRRVQGDLFHRQ